MSLKERQHGVAEVRAKVVEGLGEREDEQTKSKDWARAQLSNHSWSLNSGKHSCGHTPWCAAPEVAGRGSVAWPPGHEEGGGHGPVRWVVAERSHHWMEDSL